MVPIRLLAAARPLHSRALHRPPRIAASLVAVSRTRFRTRTAHFTSGPARDCSSQSRAPSFAQPSVSRQCFASFKNLSDNGRSITKLSDLHIIQSAFPTKTVLFLLILGGLAYYFVDIEFTDWADRVLQAFNGEPLATPLHFYKDREELDHWIQYHVPDHIAGLRDPNLLQEINSRFAEMAFGWAIEGEDAQEMGIPVTHGCRWRSNEPCEDYFAFGTAPGPGSKPWNYWSIYDGHAGRHTAAYLQWALQPLLSRALSNLSPASSSSVIHSTIKDVFLKLDADIMSRARHAANWYPAANAAAIAALWPAMAGSCALLAAFDPETSKLRIACVGDSRAVLGRWDAVERKYVAQELSKDQTGFNEEEVHRIVEAHPDELDILDPKSGRLLGLAVTRAFGDHRWKWDNDFVRQVQHKFWGTAPRPGSKTPPYMTAEPEITETDIVRADAPSGSPSALGSTTNTAKSDFLILASDGLWDHISSAHAVECVERWLESRARGQGRVAQDPQFNPPVFTSSFQLDPGVEYDVEAGEEVTWQASPEYFAIEDENAAVCLARNAMGGTRRGLFMGLVSLAMPWCRSAVDDTTIMVVFFDQLGEGKGKQKKREKEKSKWWPW